MADIITFDPAYFQELTKDLGDVSNSLNEAKANLQKASVGLDSGLVAFALCVALNNDINKIKKITDARISETNGYSKSLQSGIMRVNGWEETTRNRESGLASQLVKTWGFESGNFARETGSTASGESSAVSPGTPSNPTLAPVDLNSKYYSLPPGSIGAKVRDGQAAGYLDCCYYSHARAMEANGIDTYSPKGSGTEIQANSVAKFVNNDGTTHFVFIESLEQGANGELQVKFSEANWKGDTDGRSKTLTYDEFKNRGSGYVSGHVAEYSYF